MVRRADSEYRRDFYRALSVQDGSDPRQEMYYVPIYEREGMRDQDLVPKMLDEIDFSVGQSVQFLSGFKGCGKTSELTRLRRCLEERGYLVAWMDIEDYFNPLIPMDAPRLPHALAAGFALALDRNPNGTPVKRFMDFLARVRPRVTATAGFDNGILSGGVEVSAYLKDDPSFAAMAREAYNHNRRTFREEFHSFFQDLLRELHPDQQVVFIVDSIDHFRGIGEDFESVRASVESTFIELAEDLCIPNLHVIYTVPIYLEVGLGTNRHVVNVKLRERDGSPFDPGMAALRDVLARRAPGQDLSRVFEEDALTGLIEASGGMFRDLLRLARETLLENRELPLGPDAIDRAAMALREPYVPVLTSEQRQILRKVATTRELFTDKEMKADETQLIAMGAILRYPNSHTTWFDVHPLLKPLL